MSSSSEPKSKSNQTKEAPQVNIVSTRRANAVIPTAPVSHTINCNPPSPQPYRSQTYKPHGIQIHLSGAFSDNYISASKMTEYVDTFMETRAPKIDHGWQISASNKFSENRKQRQASQRAWERTRSFKSIVRSFVKNTKREDLTGFDVDRQFRWEDVKSMASDSIEKDKDRTKWRRNPFRAAGRSLQQGASNLEMLMTFLPNGDYTGILCGALTFVFCAAKRLDEVRNKIITCLDSLPDIVGQTEAYVDIYDDDPKVWSAAEELYLGILDGVEGMLLWIDKSAFERAFKALMLPMTFGTAVEEVSIKRNIEDKVAQFREVVQVNLHKRIGQQYKTIQTLQTQLNGLISYAKWSHENPQAVVLFKTSFINLSQLRGILNVDPRMAQKDMETGILDAQNVCPPNLINHALSVLREEKFAMWLQSNISHILLINGRMQLSPEQESSSPLTVLSCVLSQSVTQRSDRSLPLVYLCGQHNSPQDAHGGPRALLRCISSQLAHAVTQEDVDLSGIDLNFVEDIKTQRPDALCGLFRLLLFAVVGKVVFLIVDGVSWFEEGPFSQDFGQLVVFLRNLTNELNRRQPGFLLKVLLTNPSTSLHCHQWLPESCVLEMEDVDGHTEIPQDVDQFLF